ncbi:MAG: ABC transporter substrate-binding protein [Reyranella sp.]|nr:ABC transporter substrate-binding protein [Reyranella sp.]
MAAASASWPCPSGAQQKPLPVAGFLFSEAKDPSILRAESFREGLKETGYVEGQNVVVEYRWADGHRERLPDLAAELVARKVSVICAGNINCALAAKAVAGTTPIVFLTAGDPIEDGLVASFSKPGGNATGVRLFSAGLVAKRLQLLHELVPMADVIGFLVNPNNPTARDQLKAANTAATALGLGIQAVEASDERQLDEAFETLAQKKVLALAVGADPFFNARGKQVVALAAHYRLPAVYEWRESATAGGLMAYGTVLADAFRNLGVYTGRILSGAKPADLPVLQQTRFELVINLKAAAALGLKVPALLLAQADEVVE